MEKTHAGRPNGSTIGLPNRLKHYRLQRGYTQRRLAAYLKVRVSCISNAELYGRGIGMDNWLRLSELLDVDLRELKGIPSENNS